MALKTTVGPKGVVTETVAGTQDQLVVNVNNARENVRTVVSASGEVNLDLNTTTLLVAPASAGVTASLPALNSSNEGQTLRLLLDDTGNVVQVSGSDNVNGSATLAVSKSYANLELMGVKSDDDGNFHWHVLVNRGE